VEVVVELPQQQLFVVDNIVDDIVEGQEELGGIGFWTLSKNDENMKLHADVDVDVDG
jgi:hypothetical protein